MASLIGYPNYGDYTGYRGTGVYGNNLCGSGIREVSPQEYSAAALYNLPPCGDCPPFIPRKPKWVKIQQPPRVICKKRYVNVMQRIYEPQLVPVTKTIDVPHVTICSRPARIPKISYRIQVIKEPTLIYEPKEWSGPVLVTKPRITCEPQEVCTTFICRPKPQLIYVPPPEMYCCDPQGIVTTRSSGPCSPTLFGSGPTPQYPGNYSYPGNQFGHNTNIPNNYTFI